MAGYVSVNLHYEVTQTRLTFCLPGPPPRRFVFVIPTYVNKGALLFCSVLLQNLFRIRNLILPRALLALDQSAHLQISEQINTVVLWASAFFLSFFFLFYILQFAENHCALFLSHHRPNGGTSGGWVGGKWGGVGTPAGRDKCARHGRKSKRSRGYLPNFKSILGGKPECYSHLYRKI